METLNIIKDIFVRLAEIAIAIGSISSLHNFLPKNLKFNRIKKANEEFIRILTFYITQNHMLKKETFKNIMTEIAEKYSLSISDIYTAKTAVERTHLTVLASDTLCIEEKEKFFNTIEKCTFYSAETNIDYSTISSFHPIRLWLNDLSKQVALLFLFIYGSTLLSLYLKNPDSAFDDFLGILFWSIIFAILAAFLASILFSSLNFLRYKIVSGLIIVYNKYPFFQKIFSSPINRE